MDNRLLAKKASHNQVLLVDDDPTILRLLSTWLKVAGYEVIQAGDGEEALKLIQERCPDYLITDWEMPQIDGPTLCRTVRGMSLPHYMYVVFLTSRRTSDDVIDALDSGADDFLSKPVQKNELLARMVAGARLLELERKLSFLARSDVLTGLNTRRTFLEFFDKEWDRSQRHGQSLSCVMMDIDYFKRINDVHGHAVGDICLQSVARMLKDNCRTSDVVCRFAGDEFVAMLPETDYRQAGVWAERLRERIRNHLLQVGDTSTTLTATFGISEMDKHVKSPKDLLDRADQALLTAKQAGRDRVVVFGHRSHDPEHGGADHDQAIAFGTATAADVMVPCAANLPEDAPVHKAINLLLHGRNLTIAVVDAQGKFRGALAEHDLTQVVCYPQKWSQPIREFMASNFVTFDQNDDASNVYDYLSRGSVQRAFVLQNDCPVGIVSMASLMRWIEKNADSTSGSDLTAANPAAVHSLADRLLEETRRLQAELGAARDSASLDPDAADKIQALATSLLDICQQPETL